MIDPSKTSRKNKKCKSRLYTKDRKNKTSKTKLFVGSVSTLLLGMAILRLGKSEKTEDDSSHRHEANRPPEKSMTETKDKSWDLLAELDSEKEASLLTDAEVERIVSGGGHIE